MEEENKKTTFLFVFLTYLPVFLLKFRSGERVGCGMHTFDGPRYPKNKKYLKKCYDDIIITFFQIFLVFGVARRVKSIPSGYLLDAEFNSHPTSSPDRNLRKNTGRYVKNTNKKVVFFLFFFQN